MSRRRKDYRLDTQPEHFAGAPIDTLIVRFAGDESVEAFDFRVYAARAEMAAIIALAFRMHGADKSPETRRTLFVSAVRQWFAFLDAHDPEQLLKAGTDIDAALVRAFLIWLDARPARIATRYSLWSGMRSLFRWLLRHRADLVGGDLMLPYNAFPRKNALSAPREGLAQADMDAVLAACRREIDMAWRHYCTGQEALARVDRARIASTLDLGRLDLSDLGVVMAILMDRFDGVIPHNRAMLRRGAGLWRLIRAMSALGGAQHVARYLYPDSRVLIPFVIVIAAQTFGNPDAVLGFARDCASEHPLFDNRVILAWRKGRASKLQRRSFLKDKSLSPPRLIEQVLEMTAPLTRLVRRSDRGKLFLYASIQGGRHFGTLNRNTALQQVERFVADNDLKGADGRPLKLNLAMLRTTGLSRAHAALGYDLVKTQALANHASLDTTRRYVDRPLAREGQARELARLQGAFVTWVRGDADEVTRTLHVSSAAAADIATGRNATASGFVCRDPLAGAGPEQAPGRLCTAWLGCFTCPNAVIPLDLATLTRLMATRAALCDARARLTPERFALIYEPKLAILERDILPRFPDAMQLQARERAAGIAVAPIE
ncbi:MAG: hypothetical protein NW206_12050 [Hyphomonadaceae bacterium]|nr:hypothetical protein [Hyphomonadaceae bacterium]